MQMRPKKLQKLALRDEKDLRACQKREDNSECEKEPVLTVPLRAAQREFSNGCGALSKQFGISFALIHVERVCMS